MPTISIASPPDTDADAVVTEGLGAHLRGTWGSPDRSDVSLYLRDDDGRLVGGIIARVAWQWLYVERFWVDETCRGDGHGTRLLQAAEALAVERRCVGVHLDTFGDDTKAFYVRRGYQVFGTLEEFPPGARQHFLRKRLDRRSGQASA